VCCWAVSAGFCSLDCSLCFAVGIDSADLDSGELNLRALTTANRIEQPRKRIATATALG
jgi:hypothetical protein